MVVKNNTIYILDRKVIINKDFMNIWLKIFLSSKTNRRNVRKYLKAITWDILKEAYLRKLVLTNNLMKQLTNVASYYIYKDRIKMF